MNRGLLLLALLLASCGGQEGTTEAQTDEAEETSSDEAAASRHGPEVDPNLRIGHVMFEVGYRFEMAGQAAENGRWELAAYQSHEILEMFGG